MAACAGQDALHVGVGEVVALHDGAVFRRAEKALQRAVERAPEIGVRLRERIGPFRHRAAVAPKSTTASPASGTARRKPRCAIATLA
jgi:hypothetical protein